MILARGVGVVLPRGTDVASPPLTSPHAGTGHTSWYTVGAKPALAGVGWWKQRAFVGHPHVPKRRKSMWGRSAQAPECPKASLSRPEQHLARGHPLCQVRTGPKPGCCRSVRLGGLGTLMWVG